MKNFQKLTWLVMALSLLALSACGPNATGAAPTVDLGTIGTMVAGTLQVVQTQTAQAVPPPTDTLAPTPTPQPTDTLVNTPVPTPTATPTSTPTKTVVYGTIPTTSGGASNGGNGYASMGVQLSVNDVSTSTATVYAGTSMILRANVYNTGPVALQVVANLTVPDGWQVPQEKYSDCPATDDLTHGEDCTISWYFIPQGSGSVVLRVYLKGIYTDTAGNTQRITDSPAFFFNVQPAKS